MFGKSCALPRIVSSVIAYERTLDAIIFSLNPIPQAPNPKPQTLNLKATNRKHHLPTQVRMALGRRDFHTPFGDICQASMREGHVSYSLNSLKGVISG